MKTRAKKHNFYFHAWNSGKHVPFSFKKVTQDIKGVFSLYRRIKYKHSHASYTFVYPLSPHYIPSVKALRTPHCSLSLYG